MKRRRFFHKLPLFIRIYQVEGEDVHLNNFYAEQYIISTFGVILLVANLQVLAGMLFFVSVTLIIYSIICFYSVTWIIYSIICLYSVTWIINSVLCLYIQSHESYILFYVQFHLTLYFIAFSVKDLWPKFYFKIRSALYIWKKKSMNFAYMSL